MALGRRQFLQLSGLAALSAALPACGSGILPEPDVTTAGFGETASGTVTMWCRGATAAGVQVAIDRFHASQNRLHIDLTPVPDSQYVTKLATAIRGRRVPDIVDIDDINSMLFIYRGAFTDLTPVVKELPYRNVLSAGHLRLATRNDHYYGVPYLADNSVLWYNTELLDKAGVDPTRAVGNFDGLLDAARRVRRLGGDVYAWSIGGNSRHPRLRRAAPYLGHRNRQRQRNGRLTTRPHRGQPRVAANPGTLPLTLAGGPPPARLIR